MLSVDFEQSNVTYNKPIDLTDEQCGSLSCWRGSAPIDENGTTMSVVISCWQFSKEDLEEIARTGKIWLSVAGSGIPPVSLFTENPFELQTT